jgi:hypothetical protein
MPTAVLLMQLSCAINNRNRWFLACVKPLNNCSLIQKRLTARNVYNKLQGTIPILEIDSMKVSTEIKEAFTAKAK